MIIVELWLEGKTIDNIQGHYTEKGGGSIIKERIVFFEFWLKCYKT